MLLLRLALLFAITLSFHIPRAQAQTNPTYEKGLKAFGSFSGGNFDSVSVSSGKLSLHAPLVSFPQRGGALHFGFSIHYDPPVLRMEKECIPPDSTTECTYTWTWEGRGVHVAPDQGLEVSWTLVDLGNGDGSTRTIYSLVSPDGSTHQMGQTSSGAWQSLDASGLYFNPATNLAIDRSGTRYYFTGSPPTLSRIEDLNGNQISIINNAWVDTMGRSFDPRPFATQTSDFSGCTGPRPTVVASLVTVPAPSGGTLTYKFCRANVHVKSDLWGLLAGDGDHFEVDQVQQLLQSIVLPNGTAWTFEYGDPSQTVNYGGLTKIVLPTGGSISYGTGPSAQCSDTEPDSGAPWTQYLSVGSRAVDVNDGTGPHIWVYGGGETFTPTSRSVSATVTDPLLNQTTYTFTGLGASCSYYEIERKIYNGTAASGALLQTIKTDYHWTANPFDQYGDGHQDGNQRRAHSHHDNLAQCRHHRHRKGH